MFKYFTRKTKHDKYAQFTPSAPTIVDRHR